ncbi:hypothetical protein TL16_g02354 [Triparma laevis f. inornata]|uniref:Transmembrane protein n=1 Tax=Triparma laevis f. inornata TaxID=1714386 RepID=A0A9W6ZUH4_9STRA|nr:hypothetical protein TL16_g02354 [Triparma laevis f. inornata]
MEKKKKEEDEEQTEKKNTVKCVRELPYTNANLVKNIALIFTFGLVSSITAWIGCLGILLRWIALSFLAERYEKTTEGKEVKTDAQGIPFRCIVLVVFCNFDFFSTAALLAGVTVEEDEDGGGAWTPVFLSVMIIALVCQMILQVRTTTTAHEGNEGDEENQVDAVTSPVHRGNEGDVGLVEIELTEKTAKPQASKIEKEKEEEKPTPTLSKQKRPSMLKTASIKLATPVSILALKFSK